MATPFDPNAFISAIGGGNFVGNLGTPEQRLQALQERVRTQRIAGNPNAMVTDPVTGAFHGSQLLDARRAFNDNAGAVNRFAALGTAGALIGGFAPGAIGGGGSSAQLQPVTAPSFSTISPVGTAAPATSGTVTATTAAGGGGSVANGFLDNLLGDTLGDKILTGINLGSDIFGQIQQGRTQDRALDAAAFRDPSLSLGGVNVGGGQVQLPAFLEAIQGLSGQQALGVLGGTDFSNQLPQELQQALSGIVGQGTPNLNTRTNVLDSLTAGGGNLLANFGGPLSQRGDVTRANVLDIMRQQAAPGQERAVTSQLERLFGTGNLGTTGGNERREALGNVLTQQDLGFQQAAFAEGRAQDTLENQLINSAFNRFNTTAGVLGSLTGQGFGREREANQFGFGRAQDIFSTLAGAAGLPTELSSNRLALTGQLLNQFGGVQGLGLDVFKSALDQENVRSGRGIQTLQQVTGPGFDSSPIASSFSTIARGLQDRRALESLRTSQAPTTSLPVTVGASPFVPSGFQFPTIIGQ